jgi:hypothetical protein
MMMHYLGDLVVSVGIVLIFGWIFQTSASDLYLRDVLITQNEIYVAISRFTPQSLLVSYIATIEHTTRGLAYGLNLADGFGPGISQAFTMVGTIAVDVALAAPRTFAELYRQTSGTAAWIVLAGFGAAISIVIAWLVAAGISFWRLLVASALSPIAVSAVFVVLQSFMMLMLDGFFWFTSLAPYTVACPVICTFYWAAFPHAERGATLTLVYAIGRLLERPRD